GLLQQLAEELEIAGHRLPDGFAEAVGELGRQSSPLWVLLSEQARKQFEVVLAVLSVPDPDTRIEVVKVLDAMLKHVISVATSVQNFLQLVNELPELEEPYRDLRKSIENEGELLLETALAAACPRQKHRK